MAAGSLLTDHFTVSSITLAAIVSVISVVLSWAGAAFIAGYRWGTVKTRLDLLEKTQQSMATREQLTGIKEDIAEIKGMFHMVPKGVNGA